MDARVSKKDALIVVDPQIDFMPGGVLAVPGGDRIIPVVNRLVETFERVGGTVVFSRDWHPEDHCSFKPFGGQWPVHCVQNTRGAQFHPDLRIPEDVLIISKATDREKDAYSAFQETELEGVLRERGIERVFVCGLATDYCVKATALDALKRFSTVYVVTDGIAGVDLRPGDSDAALKALKERGAILITSKEVIS